MIESWFATDVTTTLLVHETIKKTFIQSNPYYAATLGEMVSGRLIGVGHKFKHIKVW